MKFSLLINMKMPTIVGIFIFISRENFMLSCAEHEKRFITSGPDAIPLHLFVLFWFACRTVTSFPAIQSLSSVTGEYRRILFFPFAFLHTKPLLEIV